MVDNSAHVEITTDYDNGLFYVIGGIAALNRFTPARLEIATCRTPWRESPQRLAALSLES